MRRLCRDVGCNGVFVADDGRGQSNLAAERDPRLNMNDRISSVQCFKSYRGPVSINGRIEDHVELGREPEAGELAEATVELEKSLESAVPERE